MEMTKLEIINETVEFYSQDTKRRAVTKSTAGNTCEYLNKDGCKCAVGRCFDENHILHSFVSSFSGNVHALAREIIKKIKGIDLEHIMLDSSIPCLELDDIFFEKYRGHNLMFWGNLQTLHDESDYWDKNTLSQRGEKYLEHLKQKYATS